MHEDLLNTSNEELESHRIEQKQIETFLNVFSQNEDNYIEQDSEGFLVIKNTKSS